MKKNILEEINRMKFYFDYTPGKVISEQKNRWLIQEQVLKYTDWTEGGKKQWENANIKNIIAYIQERDSDEKFSQSPIYLGMLQWFEENDSPETRQSLKNWLGDDLTFGLDNSPENTVNQLMKTSGLKGVDKTKILANNKTKKTSATQKPEDSIKQKQALGAILKVKNKLATSPSNEIYVNIKKEVDRLNTELTAFNSKNVFIPTESSSEIINLMNYIFSALDSKGTFNTSYGNDNYDPMTGDELIQTLKDVDVRYSAENDSRVQLSTEQTSPYKESVIAQLTIQASEQLKNKAFLDGFFRGINPTPQSMIVKAKDIRIETENISVLSQYQNEKKKENNTGVQLITTTYSWPPDNIGVEQRDEISRNFFGDDGVTITDETKGELRKKVNEAVAEYKRIMKESNNTATPKGLYLNFYSSTSKVRTTYSDKKGNYDETNNIPLSRDRIEAMKTFLNEILDESELSGFDRTVVLELSDPNVGPGWNNTESTFLDGTPMDFKTAYANAPLYLKARARNPKLTPREFYGNRDEVAVRKATQLAGTQIGTQALNDEYEQLYSRFRHATCGFNMAMEAPKTIADTGKDVDFIVSTSGGLGVIIVWTSIEWDLDLDIGGGDFKAKARKFWVRAGRAVNFTKYKQPVRKINCPIWSKN
jgi:hypothetical protein